MEGLPCHRLRSLVINYSEKKKKADGLLLSAEEVADVTIIASALRVLHQSEFIKTPEVSRAVEILTDLVDSKLGYSERDNTSVL